MILIRTVAFAAKALVNEVVKHGVRALVEAKS